MTKKDYIKFAEVLYFAMKRAEQCVHENEKRAVEQIMADLINVFASDNPRFDRDRFVAAVNGERNPNGGR